IADVAVDELPRIRPGTTLDFAANRTWDLHSSAGDELARYDWPALRFSVSWKAYCFRDEHERDSWRDHSDDLTVDASLDPLVHDLRPRGRVSGDVERNADLGLLLIDEYVQFPAQ